jgi:hypothetical protein
VSEPTPTGPKPITPARIAVWIIVGAASAFLIVSGITGIVAKG